MFSLACGLVGRSFTVKMPAYLEPCLRWQKTTIISGEFSNQGIYLDLSSWLAYLFFQKRKMVYCKLSIFVVSFELLGVIKEFFQFLNITLNQSIYGTWTPESPLPRSTRFLSTWLRFDCWAADASFLTVWVWNPRKERSMVRLVSTWNYGILTWLKIIST